MKSFVSILSTLALTACATAGSNDGNPFGAELHEVGDERYVRVAEKHGVDPDAYEAFALHRDGRCTDVYVNGVAFRTTYQQHLLVKVEACGGETVRE